MIIKDLKCIRQSLYVKQMGCITEIENIFTLYTVAYFACRVFIFSFAYDIIFDIKTERGCLNGSYI